MDKIQAQVAIAWRRMWTQTILNLLGWSLIATFCAAFVGMLIPKIWYVDYTMESWSRAWLVGAGAAACAFTMVASLFYRPSRLSIAVEIDRRFGLRERCSSALTLSNDELQSPIGIALVQDAQAKIERIDVRDGFRVRPAPQSAWVALPIAACIALLWVPDATLPEEKAKIKAASNTNTNIQNKVKPIAEAIKQQREASEANGDDESAEMFKKLEAKLEALKNNDEIDKKKLIADLNEIKNELQKKKESLGGADVMKQAMDGIKKLDKGPADKMADALKKQDFDKASDELQKIVDQLKSGNLTADQQKALEKQLEQLEQSMKDSQEKLEQAKAELKSELEKAEREGNIEKAASLRKKLEKLQAGAKQAKALEKMQGQLQKAQEAMKKGDKDAAAKAMQEMQAELDQLGEGQQSAADLEELMDELDDAKNASSCKECDGEGCDACEGKGGKGNKGNKGNKQKGEGDGNGDGQGQGDRDEQEAKFKEYDAQVRTKMQKGQTIISDGITGPNRKGISREQAREAILNSTPDAADAIESISLPKAQRDQQREYFDAIGDK